MAKQSSKSSMVIIVILLLILLTVRGFRSCNRLYTNQDKENQAPNQPAKTGHTAACRKRTLVYTKHARCRMDCRHIDENEVEAIQKTGIINYRKSNLNDKPCATYAAEGQTHDGQQVRIVFGACTNVTTVITCIDLRDEYACDCN